MIGVESSVCRRGARWSSSAWSTPSESCVGPNRFCLFPLLTVGVNAGENRLFEIFNVLFQLVEIAVFDKLVKLGREV